MTPSSSPPIETQQEFWNQHWQNAKARRVVNDWSLARFHKIVEYLQSLALRLPTILDLGCGPGWYTERLAAFGHITGVDLSEQAIAMAKARAPHIEFLAGNIYRVPLPADHFDVVVSQEVLAHVDDQPRYIDRAADVLKPGGYLILSTDNKFVMERLGDVGWVPLPPEHIDAFLDIPGLKRLLRTRFRILRMTTVLPMGHSGILRLVNSPKLNRLLELVFSRRTLTALKERAGFGLTTIVLAQKRGVR